MAIIGDGVPSSDKFALARAFNDAVDSLFLMNFMIKDQFYFSLRSWEESVMRVSDPATPSGQVPASRVVRAQLFADGLIRLGYEAEARRLVPAWGKNAAMRETLEQEIPAAPALARLCR